jgi:molybdopterin converting factor small subunit
LITVRCFGHISTTVGSDEVVLPYDELDAADLVDKVRDLTGRKEPGFSRYNTLVMLEDGEAFVPAGRRSRVADGSRVVLIPFSHGG